MKLIIIIFFLFTSKVFSSPLPDGIFIENNGQWNKSILYGVKLGDVYHWIEADKLVVEHSSNSFDTNYFKMCYLDPLPFSGVKAKKAMATVSYFKGSTTPIICNTYSEVVLENIYKDVNLRYFIHENTLRFDYILKSYLAYSQIKFKFNENVELVEGNLILNNSLYKRSIEGLKSFYYDNNNNAHFLDSRFIVNGNQVSFELDFNQSELFSELVIDPLIYSTYLGGNEYDYSVAIEIDKEDNVIIAGYTSSPSYPTTDFVVYPFIKATPNKDPDAFISKFDRIGNLMYSTFFGGFVEDRVSAVAIDSANNIIIVGSTKPSFTFPVTDTAFGRFHKGGYDAFIAKFNPTLSELIYSSLIGSMKDDFGQAVAIDKMGNAHLAGYSSFIADSMFFPTTNNAIQNRGNGNYDMFYCVVNPLGDTLLYSTLLGGIADEFVTDIAITDTEKAYILGYTKSPNYPTTWDAFDRVFNDQIADSVFGDIFISLLDYRLSRLDYSTFLGGSSMDIAYKIKFDINNDILIAGYTDSQDYPTTNNVISRSYNNTALSRTLGDGFISRLSKDGRKLLHSTYIGGIESENIYDFDSDIAGNVYITGTTNSNDYPITSKARNVMRKDTSFNDMFLTKLQPDLSGIRYSTFIGGQNRDIGWGLKVNRFAEIYLTGATSSFDFDITEDAYDNRNNEDGSTKAFFMKFIITPEEEDFPADFNFCIGESSEIYSIYSDSLDFSTGNYTIIWNPSDSIDFFNIEKPIFKSDSAGVWVYTVIIQEISSGLIFYDTVRVETHRYPELDIRGPMTAQFNVLSNYEANYQPGSTYIWTVEGGEVVNGQGSFRVGIRWTNDSSGRIKLVQISQYGCTDSTDFLNIEVFVDAEPRILFSGSLPKCAEDVLVLDSGPYFNNVFWSTGRIGRFDSIRFEGKYYFVAQNFKGETVYSDTIVVNVVPSPPPPTVRYLDGEFRCLVQAIRYQWYENNTPIPGAVDRRYRTTSTQPHRVRIWVSNGCSSISDWITDVEIEEVMNKISLMPNPAKEYLDIVLSFDVNINQLDLEIYDNLGSIIYSENYKSSSQNFNIRIDLANFVSGIYSIAIKTQNNTFWERLNVVK